MDVTRHFIRVGDREVHYRKAGSGPPLILFHVSPQSSAFVLPPLLPLADSYTLIALDTPGYGESDPLPQAAPTMVDYADAVLETLGALGIARAPIFGAHTGANVAVELARRAPERVAALVLDGLSINGPDQAHDRTAHYAPRFTPTADGAHLAWAWQHTRDQLLFWPWYEPHKPNRLRADLSSADHIHDVVLAKMAAAGYWLGYRAAFSHDAIDALRQLRVETFFVTADADVHTAAERNVAGLPPNIHFIDTTREGQVDAVHKALTGIKGDSSFTPPAMPVHRRRLYRSYVGASRAQRLVRRGGVDAGRPLVMLHGGMRTSALLAERATAMAASRPVIAVDIAGNGDSDALPKFDADLAAFAEDTRAIIAGCGVNDFDLYGEQAGATLTLEIARQAGNRTGRLILDRPELPDAATRKDMIAKVAPAIAARWDGTHFITAWHMLRDNALFWPWYRTTVEGVRDIEPEVEPVALQAQLLAFMKARLTYGAYVRAGLGADTDALLRSVKQPALVIGASGDVLESHARAAAAVLSSAKLVAADRQRPPTSAMATFLTA